METCVVAALHHDSENMGSRRTDSAARPNNVNIMSCSVWREQPSVSFCTLRTSLWASPVAWPWAWLDNTALDNGAQNLRICLLASFSTHYQQQTGQQGNKQNLWWKLALIWILLSYFYSLTHLVAKKKDMLVIREKKYKKLRDAYVLIIRCYDEKQCFRFI